MKPTKIIEFKIEGMTCNGCATTISRLLERDGVLQKEVSYPEGRARLVIDPNQATPESLAEVINQTGHYRVVDIREEEGETGVSTNGAFHLIVVGGGSAAFAAAIRAEELGATVTMINKGLPIGGTCVNVGCVPSKNLIRAAEAFHCANHPRFPGIEGRATLTSFKTVIEQKRQLVSSLRQQKYIDVLERHPNIRFVEGYGKIVDSRTVDVEGQTITGDAILIATGARPNVPPIPGLDTVDYLTNETAFELESLPKSMVVIGGRYVALETAQMFSRFGVDVTILQRSDRILPTEHVDVTEAITHYLEEEGIAIHTGVRIHQVEKGPDGVTITFEKQGNRQTLTAEKILVATGRRPNTNGMGLETVGVQLKDNGAIQVDDTLQTTVPGIYAAGDVLGENMFVYTAAYEGKLAAENAITGAGKRRDYSALPWVIFTDPQVAGVGLDELQAREQGIDVDTAMLPLSEVPRALAARDTRGFIKLISDRQSDMLVGARIVAPEGSELLMEVAMAIKYNIPVESLKDMFHPYLTLSEGIKLAAITFTKDVHELSCCAT